MQCKLFPALARDGEVGKDLPNDAKTLAFKNACRLGRLGPLKLHKAAPCERSEYRALRVAAAESPQNLAHRPLCIGVYRVL